MTQTFNIFQNAFSLLTESKGIFGVSGCRLGTGELALLVLPDYTIHKQLFSCLHTRIEKDQEEEKVKQNNGR